MPRKSRSKLKKLLPGEAVVGMPVMSQICSLNSPPTRFKVIEVGEKEEDFYRPGEFTQMINLVDEIGCGGWEMLWSRKEAVGTVFHDCGRED